MPPRHVATDDGINRRYATDAVSLAGVPALKGRAKFIATLRVEFKRPYDKTYGNVT